MPARTVHQRDHRAHRNHGHARPVKKEPKMTKAQLYAQIGLVIVIIAGIVAMAFVVS